MLFVCRLRSYLQDLSQNKVTCMPQSRAWLWSGIVGGPVRVICAPKIYHEEMVMIGEALLLIGVEIKLISSWPMLIVIRRLIIPAAEPRTIWVTNCPPVQNNVALKRIFWCKRLVQDYYCAMVSWTKKRFWLLLRVFIWEYSKKVWSSYPKQQSFY